MYTLWRGATGNVSLHIQYMLTQPMRQGKVKQLCIHLPSLLEKVALGKDWVDNGFEDRDEDEDEYCVEGLHLVWLHGHFSQLTIHTHSLQGPAGTLEGG